MSDPIEIADYIPVGKIVGTHGVKGVSRVYSYAESPEIYQPNRRLLVILPSGKRAVYRINWAKPHARVILLALEGVTDMEQALALAGAELHIEKALLPQTEEDEYYWFDLIGLKVFTPDGRLLGKIESIMRTGSNDVYVVRGLAGDSKREILIPGTVSVVRRVDLAAGQMTVDLPEGL